MFNIRLFVILLILLPFAIWAISIAPWAPTRPRDYKRILDLANFKWWEKVYEVGSWDGRISLFLWQQEKKINIIWLEINFYQYFYSKIKKYFLKCDNISFLNRNIFKYDLSDADVIYLYWLPQNNHKLAEKFQKELKKWTRIISYVFEIPELKLIEQNKPSKEELSIYVYEI